MDLSLVKSREDEIILFYIEFGKGYRRFEWKMETRRVEKLDLGLVKSKEDEIILFYIWKRISKILMDGILNGKWKRGEWKSWI